MERPRSRPPTINDVARAAKVSKSLVSLAIRGDSGVSEATRKLILETAERLGYRSNSWARSLARGRSQLIGILVNDLGSGYHVDVVRGVEDTAAREDLNVLLADGRRDPSVSHDRLSDLLELGVDGIVVVSGRVHADTLASIATRCPVVVVGRPRGIPDGVAQVSNDDRAGARFAIHHLVALGHRRVVHVTDSTLPAASDRRAAFLTTLAELGLDTDGSVLSVDGAAELVARLVARDPLAPTAVFARNDRTAVQIMGEAIDAGLRIPEDLSVTGYDNTDLATIVRPALTSVDQPRGAMGALAMTLLTELMSGRRSRHEIVQPQLVVRDSTAAAPGWTAAGGP